jgi:hypothetical protein
MLGTITREGTMSRSARPLALCFLLFAPLPVQAQPPVQPRTDVLGDPLPPHAIARLGTLRLRHSDTVAQVTFSPDGKQLVSCDRHTVSCWDAATGKLRHALRAPHVSDVQVVCFSADGKWLAVGGGQWLTVFDAATGKLHARHRAEHSQAHALHFTPDGNTLVAVGPVKLIVWDVAADKHRHAPLYLKGYLLTSAVSGDGKTLLTLTSHNVLTHWRLDGGERVDRQLPPDEQRLQHAALSADGKLLAAWPDGGPLTVRDLGTGKLLPGFAQSEPAPCPVAFSADGRTLLTGSADETALAWDVTHLPAPVTPKPLTNSELTRHWADLFERDADVAHRAMAALAAAPQQTPDWIKRHVAPVPALDLPQIVKYVAALDADKFAVREQAQTALRKCGELAVPFLEAELQKPLSLEKKRRIEQLLA